MIVKPLYFCVNEETDLYVKLNDIDVVADGNKKDAFRMAIEKKLEEVEKEYTGTKTAIVRNVLKLIPVISKKS